MRHILHPLGPLMIVVEFAEYGNLLRHLRDRRKQNYEDMNEYTLDISSAERLRIACDVSNGMKHLAAMKVRYSGGGGGVFLFKQTLWQTS